MTPGFGDTLYMLARQMRVLAVDARPATSEPWMMSHAWKAISQANTGPRPHTTTSIITAATTTVASTSTTAPDD